MISAKKGVSVRIITLVFFILAAVFTVTICSKSSPIYPLNDWDDPNCFFTVGKAMANGKILYKDIFEQKGPLLYMLHMLAYQISAKTFLGVYFIEIISCFFFLCFSYKTILLFSKGKSLEPIALLCAFVFTSFAFCSGDSAEELCLPLLSYSFYTALSCVKKNKPLPFSHALISGIWLGAILWIKFTMLGFYIGFVIAFIILYIRQKNIRRIWSSAAVMIAGIIISSIPIIIYFLKYNAFDQLIEVYFYDNVFMYTTGSDIPPVLRHIVNLFSGLLSFFLNNPFGLLCLILGYIRIFRKESIQLRIVFTAITVSTFFFSFVGGRSYAYYSLVMSVFAPPGVSLVYDIVRKKLQDKNNKRLTAAVKTGAYALSLAVTVFMCRNIYLVFTPKQELPQFRFNKIISAAENPTLLNYGFLDGGFYTVSGIVPDCRFFCELNIELDEMYEVQNEYVKNGKAVFVVTKDEKPEFEMYECIDQAESRYWSQTSTYYLYRLKSYNESAVDS